MQESQRKSLYRKEPPPPDNPIVIVRPPPTKRERLFRALGKTLSWTLRTLFLIIIFVLCSIGMTAIVNEPIRNILFDMLLKR